MIRFAPLFCLIFIAGSISAQLDITAVSVPVTVDFSGFDASGFDPAPTAGQLDSDTWALSGFSDGDISFGGTGTTGDFARGTTSGGETSGGIYAYTGGTGTALWIQPTGSDFTPGSLTLKVRNQSGVVMTALDVDYDVLILNDQDRANSFNFSWSADDVTYVNVSAADIASLEAQDGILTSESRSVAITGITIADGATMFLRWTGDDISGSGSRDEFGIESVTAEFPGGPAVPAFQFNATTGSVSEGGLSYDLSVTLSAPADCDVDVILNATASTATEGLDFTYPAVMTLNFTATGVLVQDVSVPIIDDTDAESTESAVFELQNATGSGGCVIGAISVFDLVITDNEVSTTGPCLNLFFSEYIEGTSNNKALEIVNPSSAPIDLSTYTISTYANGATTSSNTLNLTGILLPGDVYMIVNGSADSLILSIADTTSTVTFFNGNDAVELSQGSTSIDILGEIGVDLGCWPVGTGAMCENTLVRKPGIQQGETDWSLSSGQWDVLPQDDFSNFGMHSYIPCGGTSPVLSFASASSTVDETAGSLNIEVTIVNPDTVDMQVDVIVDGGTASAADHGFTALTLVFPASSTMSQLVNVPITDDGLAEGTETLVLRLDNASAGVIFGSDIHTITILDDEFAASDISDVHEEDANGVAVSLGDQVSVTGVVYGVDMRAGDGLQFTIIDATGGIAPFSFDEEFGYAVLETDEVRIDGTIDQFNGLTQINPDTIILISTGASLKLPDVVTVLDENTESDLVKIENAELVNSAQWLGDGSSFNVDITDGISSWVMRIDDQVDLSSMPAPSGKFHVTGIGGQFDPAAPFDEGYQIFPRYEPDIEPAIEDTTGTGFEAPAFVVGIFPNPVNDVLRISSGADLQQVSLYDLSGKLIIEQSAAGKSLLLYCSAIAAGTYILKLMGRNAIVAEKIVISR